MAYSTKRLARLICSIAFSIYFIIIIFQVPIFSVPYRKGICKTPLEVITASEVFPRFIVKALLYPGAVANAIWKHKSIPSYKNLLKLYNFNSRTISAASNLQRLEVLVGSYMAVGGAIIGLIKPGRMGFLGILLLLWGLIKELIMGKSTWGIQIYPAMYIALISAFFSIRKDVRRLIRSFTRKHRKEKGF